MDFKNSLTKDNLMRAFAGESQARNRYTLAAAQARKENLYVIEALFNYTAGQEKEHAEIFYGHLKEMAGDFLLKPPVEPKAPTLEASTLPTAFKEVAS